MTFTPGWIAGWFFVPIMNLFRPYEAVKELYGERHLTRESEPHSPDYLVPMAYPFPDVGRIVGLIFIPFAAWFYGEPMAQTDYPLFGLIGLFLSFGKVTTTVPFLLEMEQLPFLLKQKSQKK